MILYDLDRLKEELGGAWEHIQKLERVVRVLSSNPGNEFSAAAKARELLDAGI